ncbi:hypothetical protein E8E12_005978 [Didymella heteroderae]|uniref:Clr5 domain-containing protein n=1 Tax=Didymella heteroderae TaxID=1769908 RepID=A0A9P4WVF7_9PLEO|nr:hypothetical protein E8E12_005978 [Didymella heteroderae]
MDLSFWNTWPSDANNFQLTDDSSLASLWTSLPNNTFSSTVETLDTISDGLVDVLEQAFALPGDVNEPAAKRRKPKAKTLRDKDWEPYKARIIELYSQLSMDLQSVQMIIKDEYGFKPELRQYEKVIEKWKLSKNIKTREIAAIVRKQQQRDLVDVNKGPLAFSVRGKPVEPERRQRWMRSRGVSKNELYAPDSAASTPSDVDCLTISEPSSPMQDSTDPPSGLPQATYLLAVFETMDEINGTMTREYAVHDYCSTALLVCTYARITIRKRVGADVAKFALVAKRESIYQTWKSVFDADTSKISWDIKRIAEGLHDALSAIEYVMGSIEQSRYALTARNGRDFEVLNLEAQHFRRLFELLYCTDTEFLDLEERFCTLGMKLCFCDVVRTLRMEQWWSQKMELKALEEMQLLRSVSDRRCPASGIAEEMVSSTDLVVDPSDEA